MTFPLKLYEHQKRFLLRNPDKALLSHECSTGKTLIGALWLQSRDSHAFVICPLRVVDKWRDQLKEVGTKATVLTKEQFKKTEIIDPSALFVDECHHFSSPLFTRQRSQLSERLYALVQKYPRMPIVLATATPIRSSPANLHSLLCFTGQYIPWKQWRDAFYTLERRPYLARPAWFPKKNWRITIRGVLKKYADIVLLRDCVAELPKEEELIVQVKCERFQRQTEWEPMRAFVEEHRHEQKNKAKKILELSEGYRKVMVAVHFREHMEELEKELSKHRQTYVVHGNTKNAEEVIRMAEADGECFLLAQASLGEGWKAPSFRVIIFSSMNYSYVSLVQMKGRIAAIGSHVLPSRFYFLIGGRCDKGIMERLRLGKSFDPRYWLKEYGDF